MRRAASPPLGGLTSGRILLTVLVALCLAPSCTSTLSPGDEMLFAAAETAVAMSHVGEAVFWELPRFLFWTAPKAMFYDLPREGVLAIAGRRMIVEDALHRLSAEDLSIEDELLICQELRGLTGIPLRSREGWLNWWETGRDLDPPEWLPAFVASQIDLLESPDYFQRAASIEYLTTLYGTDLGYDPKQAPAELRGGARRWEAHLEKEPSPAE